MFSTPDLPSSYRETRIRNIIEEVMPCPLSSTSEKRRISYAYCLSTLANLKQQCLHFGLELDDSTQWHGNNAPQQQQQAVPQQE